MKIFWKVVALMNIAGAVIYAVQGEWWWAGFGFVLSIYAAERSGEME